MSAASDTAIATTSNAPESWEEEDFIHALARLERIQNQLDTVRIIPHQILSSLTADHRDPPELFRQFHTAAFEGSKALDKFKRGWEEPSSKALFERTAKSEQNDGNPAAGNDVELWGWVEREAELSKGSNGTMANNKTALEKEDAIEELWSGDDKVTMTVNVKGKGVNLDFTITKRLLDGSIAYDAECVGESQESQAISQSLASRKPLNNLPFLMDMVHSFKDLRTARCVKCNRLLDQRGLLPTSRRQAEMKTMDKVNVDKVWQAVHEGCL